MSARQDCFWLQPPKAKQPKPFNLLQQVSDNIYYPNRPVFQLAVRMFASSRRHSQAELDQFFEIFEQEPFYFHEWQVRSRDFHLYPLVETLRYARRCFWKLVAHEKSKAAGRLVETLSIFMEFVESKSRVEPYDSPEKVTKKEARKKIVAIAHDSIARFILARYLSKERDAGFDFFSGQTFKTMLSITSKASKETEEFVLVSILQKFIKDLQPMESYKPHVDYAVWAKMKALFLHLIGCGKPELFPKSVLVLLGRLLSLLRTQSFHHEPLSHRRDRKNELTPDGVRMKEFIGSVELCLTVTHQWLCHRPIKLEIKPWYYDQM